MKIIIICAQREIGGAQTRALDLADYCRTRGFDVYFYFLYRKREVFTERAEAYDLLESNLIKWSNLGVLVRELANVLRDKKPAVVYAFQAPTFTLVSPIAALMGVKRRVAIVTQPPGKLNVVLRLWDLLLGITGLHTNVVVNSNYTRDQYSRYPSAYRDRISKVYVGVNFPQQAPRLPKLGAVEDTRLSRLKLVCVGRLSIQKNHMLILRAMTNAPDNWELTIIGEGELRDTLQQYAIDHDIAGKVSFAGEIERARLFQVLPEFDIFIFPSSWETFGIAAIDACACGLPVVASDIPVLREVLDLESGRMAGLLFEPDNVASLIASIKLVESDPMLSASLVQNGLLLVERYTAERMGDDFLEVADVHAT